MAGVLSFSEVRLSEEVLHDIKTEGKMFKIDLVDIQQSYEDLAGADYTKSALSAAENQQKLPMPRIQLEKLNDRLVRLFITVYKSSVEMATEAEVQTVVGNDETPTQTDSSEWMQSRDTQTNVSDWHHIIGTQTDWSEWLHCAATQTDVNADPQVIGTQTDWNEWLHSAGIQTDYSNWQTSVTTQTDMKQLASTAAQTKETRVEQMFSDVAVETKANLSTQVNELVQAVVVMSNAQSQMSVETADSHCQMTPDVVDSIMQTERHDVNTEAQTESSIAWRADHEVQAVVAISESAVQASAPVNAINCQTDSSMANLLSRYVQASMELTCSDSQTDLSQSDSEAQTEMSMSQQVSSEVQAVVALTDSQTDHDLSHIDADVPTASLPATQDSVINESFDDIPGNVTLPLDTSLQQPLDHSLMQDVSSQTDPVTIIIGDASFLVKKLKNSAGSPSRVTTTGNEIEIELSADAVTEENQAAVPPSDGKENEMMHQQAALLQQPAMVRSGGVMCRGGGVSGPRFRMPVSQSPPAKMPSGLIVRHPTQQMVIAPQLQQQALAGPQPVIGGSFSCPFCSLTFIDSPALYEHLSIMHTVDQKTKWKQPRGREGKTIVPVKRSGRSPGTVSQIELSPPVLVPVETFNLSVGGDGHILGGIGQQSDVDRSSLQEAGLFEDPVEPQVIKKQRGRPSKHVGEDGDGDGPSKRQKLMEEDDDDGETVKSNQQVTSGDASADEQQNVVPATRRSGRTPRGRRRS